MWELDDVTFHRLRQHCRMREAEERQAEARRTLQLLQLIHPAKVQEKARALERSEREATRALERQYVELGLMEPRKSCTAEEFAAQLRQGPGA